MHNDDRELLLRTTQDGAPPDDKSAQPLASAERDAGSGESDDRNQRNEEPPAERPGVESCQPGANRDPDAEVVDRAFNAVSDALVAAGVTDTIAGSCALMVSAAIARVQGLDLRAFMAIAGGAWESAGRALAAGAIEIVRGEPESGHGR